MKRMLIDPEILAALIGFSLGSMASVIRDIYKTRLNKKVVLKAIKFELLGIKSLQKESTWVSLPINIWGEIEKSKTLLEVNEELQNGIIELYSKLSNKNNLLRYYKSGVEAGGQISVVSGDGTKSRPTQDIIVDITTNVFSIIEKLIPLIDSEIDC